MKISLRAARAQRDKTQEDCAKELGLARQNYQMKECGARQFKVDEAEKLCKFLNFAFTDIDWGNPT